MQICVAILPSKETPVPAILAGRGLRAAGTGLLLIKPDVDIVVDVDMALPGLDVLFKWPPGVTVPEREPKHDKDKNKMILIYSLNVIPLNRINKCNKMNDLMKN